MHWPLILKFVHSSYPFQYIKDEFDVQDAIKNGQPPALRPNFGNKKKEHAIDVEFWNLLEACWAIDPNERPNIAEVVVKLGEIFKIRSEKL